MRRIWRWICAGVAFVSLCSVVICNAGMQQAVFSAGELFPLQKGAYWVYHGYVQWTGAGSPGVRQREITWKMEVVDSIQRPGVQAARLKGHPHDLVWFEDGRQQGSYVMLVLGRQVFLLSGGRAEEAWRRLQDDADNLQQLVLADELFLEVPSKISRNPDEAQVSRTADGYQWKLEILRDQPGGHAWEPWRQDQPVYHFSYTSLPDTVIVDVVPRVGIVQFSYEHHGMPAATQMNLIAYQAG